MSNTEQHIHSLLKKSFNVISTYKDTEWYNEEYGRYQTIFEGNDINIQTPPLVPVWQDASLNDASLSEYNINPTDTFSTASTVFPYLNSVVDAHFSDEIGKLPGAYLDTSGSVMLFVRVKLDKFDIAGIDPSANVYTKYLADTSLNSLLSNSFQFNYNTQFDVSSGPSTTISVFKPYAYTLEYLASDGTSEFTVVTNSIGNWSFDFKSGIITFSNDPKDDDITIDLDNGDLYFTFVKYVGARGLDKLVEVRENFDKDTAAPGYDNQIIVDSDNNGVFLYKPGIDGGWTSVGGKFDVSGTDIFYADGNVGIGTSSPSTNLDVSGSVNVSNSLTVDKDLVVDGLLNVGNIIDIEGKIDTLDVSVAALEVHGGIVDASISALEDHDIVVDASISALEVHDIVVDASISALEEKTTDITYGGSITVFANDVSLNGGLTVGGTTKILNSFVIEQNGVLDSDEPQLLVKPYSINSNDAEIRIQAARANDNTSILSSLTFSNYDKDYNSGAGIEHFLCRIGGRVSNKDDNLGGFVICNFPNGITQTQALTMSTNGNFKIGDSVTFQDNDTYKLEVVGNTQIAQKLDVSGDLTIDGSLNIGGNVVCKSLQSFDATVDTDVHNKLSQVFSTSNEYNVLDRNIELGKSSNGGYRSYYIGLLGNGSSSNNVFCIAAHGGGAPDPDPIFAINQQGNAEIAGNCTIGSDLTVVGDVTANNFSTGSDDRIKENEKLIVNATETLSKLTPQIYDKYQNMDLSGSFHVESGLVAQEVYYNAPELRHLVVIGKEYDASGNDITPTPDEMDLSGVDIGSDPDYGSHGWSKTKKSALNYQGLIAYLIKSNQEMNTQYNVEKEKAATLETEVSTLKTQMTEILARLSSLESSSQNNSVTVDAIDNPTAV